MQWIANAILSIGAVSLLAVGGYLAFLDKTASAAAVLGFAFLLLVLLLLAKFKRFKGFGFEAEMWEEKQVEAAELVDRLTVLSQAISQQVALIASRLGLWGGSLSNPEIADLAEQVSQLLRTGGATQSRINEILDPVYVRIEQNYWMAVHRLIHQALQGKGSIADRQQFEQISLAQFFTDRSIKPLISFAKSCHDLAEVKQIQAELNELNLDFEHFQRSRSLRRRLDVAEVPSRLIVTSR
jgi:hypothetical protein